ncbi:MAG: TldD/PmbA family protein [Gloeomargarita sp. SKYBB_i_bin120]|nr:TldD/PmbA family protein [Gloeomargarita sp. SKYG98]MCS7292556.1 TldD/PmbA family protein [Gloeomargarita sp. SKYB120]MDW8178117.1 TldD/PmbA family protein [Gloeomargarita sp. SKYBB_i_bin120]
MDLATDSWISALLERAKRAGAAAVQIHLEHHQSQPVQFEANRLKSLERSESQTVALWLWRDGCPGVAVAAGPVSPDWLVEKALAVAALHPPEPPRLVAGGVQQFQDQPPAPDPHDLIPWGEAVIAGVRQAFPEVLCSGGLSWQQSFTRLVNSEGLDYSYRAGALEVGMACEWVRGDDFLAVGEHLRLATLSDPQPLVDRLCQSLTWARQNVQGLSGQWPVLLTPKAADLLWEPVQAALNGRQVLEGASPWADKRGQLVVHPCLTCRQDPHLSLHGCPFDDEGVLTQPLTLIEQGVLTRFYTDQYTASQWGETSTGNGFRPGLTRAPFPMLVNWWVQPGTLTDQELLQQLDKGLLVDQVLGGGADISGDFSVNVDLGYWVEGGVVQGRVKDTMIAGNVYDILQADMVVGAAAAWQDDTFSPPLVVQRVTITSAS